MNFYSLFTALSSLLVPVECLSCSTEGEIICANCRNKLFTQPGHRSALLTTVHGPLPISAYLPFSREVSRIVLGAKDDGNQKLEKIMIASLRKARSYFPPNMILVPIPSTSRARRKRARDFIFDITQQVAQESGDQVLKLLTWTRRTAPQKNLSAHDRALNMDGAFEVSPEITLKNRSAIHTHQLLLVDDVLTTGATMREGFRALQAGGARCIGGISAAYSLNWSVSARAH